MRTTITTYVNGHWEMLDACSSLACYAEEFNLFVDKMTITCGANDNWVIYCEMVEMTKPLTFDRIPF